MKDVLKVGEVAEQLKIKKSLVRQWKQQFEINPNNPFYTPEDVSKLKQVNTLLKNHGLSVEEVKVKIHAATSAPAQVSPQIKTERHNAAPESTSHEVKDNTAQIISDITSRMLEASLKNVKTVPVTYQEKSVAPAKAAPKDVEVAPEKVHATPVEKPEVHAASTKAPCSEAQPVQAQQAHREFHSKLSAFKEELLRLRELLN